LLIASPAVTGTLEDQSLPVVAEVSLGIFAAIRELANVAQVPFPRLGRDFNPRRRLLRAGAPAGYEE
jgi:hypothetical protein